MTPISPSRLEVVSDDTLDYMVGFVGRVVKAAGKNAQHFDVANLAALKQLQRLRPIVEMVRAMDGDALDGVIDYVEGAHAINAKYGRGSKQITDKLESVLAMLRALASAVKQLTEESGHGS